MHTETSYHYPQQGNLVVLGAGESGTGAALLALQKGFNVFVSDSGTIAEPYRTELADAGVVFEEGGHSAERILLADLVIKSPGIPEKAPLVQQLRKNGIPVIGEIEFAAQYTRAKLIAITGSNGKSTTTMLTWFILHNAGLHVGLAGNIGHSFARQVATEQYDYYVLEISSFMLDDMNFFRAHIGALLNITPDHLDRYAYSLDAYAASKFRIVRNQHPEDVFIFCADDPETMKRIDHYPTPAQMLGVSQQQELSDGAFLNDKNEIEIHIANQPVFNMSIYELALQGRHNVYNSMVAGLVSKVLELRNESIRESMGEYKNIPHRLEHVARIAGIDYINDSKATNVNAVWYALESMPAPVVLLMGGVDKGNDYTMLTDLVRSRVRGIVCIGKDNKSIHEAFENEVEIIVNSMEMQEAVQIASHIARKGDTVLLSPACASFDLFKNYEDRGDQFKAAVREL